MREAVGQRAVVGEQDQAARVRVQAPDRIQAQAALGHEPQHRRSAVRVAHGGEHADGLVDREAHPRLGPLQQAAVERHAAVLPHGHRRVARRLPLDAHAPGGDQRLGRAARGHAGVRQVLG